MKKCGYWGKRFSPQRADNREKKHYPKEKGEI